jgi:hypothetical protein
MTGFFSWTAIVRMLSEASTPFLNFRFFLLAFDMKHTKLFVVNGYLLNLFFFLFRLVPIIPLWTHFYHLVNVSESLDSPVILFTALLGTFADGLNLFWFQILLRKSVQFLKKTKEA